MRIARRFMIAMLSVVLVSTGAAQLVRAQDKNDESGWLGVYTQTLTDELRAGIEYRGGGVIVNRVISDSPAADAGIEEGDVITAVGGNSVDSPDELADLIQSRRPGSRVMIRVVRDGRTRNINVRIGSRPQDEERSNMRWYRMDSGDEKGSEKGDESSEPHVFRLNGDDIQIPDIDVPGLVRMMGRGRLGVRVETLNEDLGSYFKVPDGKGVLIVEVMKDTPAEKAGLKAGDVILEVGGEKVSDADDLVRELRSKDEGAVSLDIMRNGSHRTVEAELEKSPNAFHWSNDGDRSFSFNFDKNMRNHIRDQIRRSRDDTHGMSDDLRQQMQELRDELRQLKRELQDLKEGN